MIVFILIVELLNTAIEKLSDRITLDQIRRQRVKDMGSAAILLSLCSRRGVALDRRRAVLASCG